MQPRAATFALLVAVATLFVASAAEREILRKFLLGQSAPEIVADRGDWLGSSEPTTLKQLKGRVTWLQFNF